MQRYQPLEFRSVENRIDCADNRGELEKAKSLKFEQGRAERAAVVEVADRRGVAEPAIHGAGASLFHSPQHSCGLRRR